MYPDFADAFPPCTRRRMLRVVALGLADREGHHIGFWEFTKYGLVVTAVTVTLCVPYLWLRYL